MKPNPNRMKQFAKLKRKLEFPIFSRDAYWYAVNSEIYFRSDNAAHGSKGIVIDELLLQRNIQARDNN